MNQVFLSHNHLDKPFVRMLAADIKASSINVWLDELEIKIGDSLIVKIAEAIDHAAYVVAFLSPSSIKSNWVQKELSIAITLGINNNRVFVLPLLIGELETKQIPVFLIDQLFADFRQPCKYDIAFRELLQRLKPRKNSDGVLIIDAFRKNRLVEIAQDMSMRDWILDYIVDTLDKRNDPTERYWSYLTLGEVGGDKAFYSIEEGLNDPNEFARMGALEAFQNLKL